MSSSPSGTASASSWCNRSASQAPPVWMPTMPVSGVTCARSWPTRSAQSVSASGSCMAVEEVLQDRLRGERVREILVRATAAAHRAQPLRRLGGCEPFVDERHREPEAPLELAREALRPVGQRVRRAVEGERQPDDEPRGLPLLDQLGDRREPRAARRVVDRRKRVGDADAGLADGDADEALTEVEREHRVDSAHWLTLALKRAK